jgi:hypothetical protein
MCSSWTALSIWLSFWSYLEQWWRPWITLYNAWHVYCLQSILQPFLSELGLPQTIIVSWWRELQTHLEFTLWSRVSGLGRGPVARWGSPLTSADSHPQCHQSSESIRRPRRRSQGWQPAWDATLRAFPCPESPGWKMAWMSQPRGPNSFPFWVRMPTLSVGYSHPGQADSHLRNGNERKDSFLSLLGT